jgi:SnoaL-like domain
MNQTEAHQIAQRLITAFAWCVDRASGRGIGALFTKNARLILPSGPPDWSKSSMVEGRDNLVARWAARPADRVTRHLHLNIEVVEVAPARIASRCVGVGYKHDGLGWGEPAPVIVADYDDILALEDGEWRFEERKVTPVFVSPQLQV